MTKKVKKRKHNFFQHTSVISGIMGIAMLFMTVVLARDAVVQFIAERYFSGSISALGTVLFLIITVLFAIDLFKNSKKAVTSV